MEQLPSLFVWALLGFILVMALKKRNTRRAEHSKAQHAKPAQKPQKQPDKEAIDRKERQRIFMLGYQAAAAGFRHKGSHKGDELFMDRDSKMYRLDGLKIVPLFKDDTVVMPAGKPYTNGKSVQYAEDEAFFAKTHQ